MTRARQLLTGLAALLLLIALVGGIPWALWHYIGWPLPHAVPSWDSLKVGLSARTIAPTTLLKALAIVVWLGWAVLTVSVISEAGAAIKGRVGRRVPLRGGPLQPLVGGLITAIAIALLAALPRPSHGGPPPLAASLQHIAAASAVLPAGSRLVGTGPAAAAATRRQALAGEATAGRIAGDAAAADRQAGAARYLVQRRDTLWAIAQTQLGDPTRWREIFTLNRGRAQPGGSALSDPNRIWPGWTLLLPAAAAPDHGLTDPPAPNLQPATSPDHGSGGRPAAAANPASPGSAGGMTAAPSTSGSPRYAPGAPSGSPPQGRSPGATSPGADGDDRSDQEGPLVAAALAAGISAAFGYALRHRRRRYQSRPPTIRAAAPPLPSRPRVHAAAPVVRADDDHGTEVAPEQPVTTHALVAAVDSGAPGAVAVSLRPDGHEHAIDLLAGGGLTLTGQGAPSVARSVLLTLLFRAGGSASEQSGDASGRTGALLVLAGAAGALLPTATELSSVRRQDPAAALAHARAEVARRARLAPAAAGASRDFRTLAAAYPDEPLPLLILVGSGTPADLAGEMAQLAADGGPVGVTALHVQGPKPTPVREGYDSPRCWPTELHVEADGRVTDPHGATDTGADTNCGPTAAPLAPPGHGRLASTDQAFMLDEPQAAELLSLLAQAQGHDPQCAADRPPTPPASSANGMEPASPGPASDLPPDRPAHPPTRHDQQQPAPSADRRDGAAENEPAVVAPAAGSGAVPGDGGPLVRLELLGPLTVIAAGAPVDDQLRAKARELLAYLGTHPDGATADTLAELLWPQAPPERSRQRLHTVIATIRSTLREASGQPEEQFVTLSKERYRLHSAAVACDYAELAALHNKLAAQPTNTDDRAELELLASAARLSAGELLADLPIDWAEDLREAHRQSQLDVLMQLAALHATHGHRHEQIAALTQAQRVDPYAEHVAQELITAQLHAGERAAALRAYRLLEERLTELGVDPDPATARLVNGLRQPAPSDGPRIRRDGVI